MRIDELRRIVEEGGRTVQWAGFTDAECSVRISDGNSTTKLCVDLPTDSYGNDDNTVSYNMDSDHDSMGSNVSVFPPDTSVFKEMRMMSILGANTGGPCRPGTGFKYTKVSACYCAYDIETDMSRNVDGGLGLVGVPIISIAALCSCGEELFLPVESGVFTSEDACRAFLGWIREHRPLWLLGYNCFAYDNMHIVHHLPKQERSDFLSIRVGGVGSGSDASLINMWGVYNVDLYVYLMRTRQSDFESMKLEHVAKKLQCTEKLQMPPMTQKVEYSVLREYNINDCRVVLDVWTKSHMDDELPCLAVCTASHVYDSCRFVTGFMLTCGCASEAIVLGRTIDWSPCPTPAGYGGGLVLEPKRGVFEDVEVHDFKSMYPSIIIACNISSESIVSKRPLALSDDASPDYVKTSGGCRVKLETSVVEFGDSQDGIPKVILQKLVNLRQMVKSTDPPYAMALKIGANSLFGVLGYEESSMYSPSCSSAITTVARFCLRTSRDISESNGGTVIYGDTDSIFSVTPANVPKGYDLSASVTTRLSSIGLRGVVLAKEATYPRVVMMGKKRYCAIEDSGKVKLTGISAVRSDSYGIVRNASRRMAMILLLAPMNLIRVALANYCTLVLDALHGSRLSLREASRLVKRHGKKVYLYRDASGMEHLDPVDEALPDKMVSVDVSILAESLGKEMTRFSSVCGAGSAGECVRDHCTLLY